MNREIMTRKLAVSRGLIKYYTGVPCKRGHLLPRYTRSSACSGCLAVYHKQFQNQVNTNKMMDALGFAELTVKVKPELIEMVKDFCDVANEKYMNPRGGVDYIKIVADFIQALNQSRRL